MGPESKVDLNSLTLYLGDTPIARGKIRLEEITMPEEVMHPGGGLPYKYAGCTLYFKIPKNWRCRNRKRFMKLMMSEGVSRNCAERMADFARELMPYGEAWMNHILHKGG